MSVIAVLAGLVFTFGGIAIDKGARSRIQVEIKAIEGACENYKADNGAYPRSGTTDSLNARTSFDPNAYQASCAELYAQLTGDSNYDDTTDPGAKAYMSFKPEMKGVPDTTQAPSSANKTFVRDPFRNTYGYSTANQTNQTQGYNPTFDLWSTGSKDILPDQVRWIKNW